MDLVKKFTSEKTEVMERLIEVSQITDKGLLRPIADEYYTLLDHGYSSDEALDKIETRFRKRIMYLK